MFVLLTDLSNNETPLKAVYVSINSHCVMVYLENVPEGVAFSYQPDGDFWRCFDNEYAGSYRNIGCCSR